MMKNPFSSMAATTSRVRVVVWSHRSCTSLILLWERRKLQVLHLHMSGGKEASAIREALVGD
jgi:hypothetical protein